jgi:hypothetical protein
MNKTKSTLGDQPAFPIPQLNQATTDRDAWKQVAEELVTVLRDHGLHCCTDPHCEDITCAALRRFNTLKAKQP